MSGWVGNSPGSLFTVVILKMFPGLICHSLQDLLHILLIPSEDSIKTLKMKT